MLQSPSPPRLYAAPVLETARLRLRGHTVEDFAHSAALWADPIVTRYIGGRPFNKEEVWARLLRYPGLWALMGFGYWLVEEKATGRFIGEIGFGDFKRDMEPSLVGRPEAGWVLASACHGQGFGSEAVKAILAWGDIHLSTLALTNPRPVCIIHPENSASLRVAEKCGFRETLRTTYKDQPTIILER